MLSCTASSSIEDLHGDTITAECVQDMAMQAKTKGMLIFLNHKYNVPEDVFGGTVDAKALSRAQDGEGTAIWDMDLDIELATSNPRTGKTMELIETDKKKLGVSIGAQIMEWEFKDKDAGWFGGLIIKKVDLLEASIVGIPANQRSWVQNAVAAIKRASTHPDTDDDGDDQTTFGQFGAPLLPLQPAIAAGITTPMVGIEAKLGETVTLTSEPAVIKNDTDDAVETDPAETPEADAAETEGDAEASAEPGTDDPAQESTELPADDAALDGTPTTEASASSQAVEDDGSLASALAEGLVKATGDLRTMTARNSALEVENAALKGDLTKAQEHAAAADQLIELIAKLPLGRKTAFATPIDTFAATVRKIYGEDAANKLVE